MENKFFRQLLAHLGQKDPSGRALVLDDLVPGSLAPGLYRGRLPWQQVRQAFPGCSLYVVLRHPVQATILSYLQRSSERAQQSLQEWMETGYLTNPQCWLLGGAGWVSESLETPAPAQLEVESALREALICLDSAAALVVRAEHETLAYQQLADHFSQALPSPPIEEIDVLAGSVELVGPELKGRILEENAGDMALYQRLAAPSLHPQVLTLEAGRNLHFDESHQLEALADGRLFYWTSTPQSRVKLPAIEILPGKVRLGVEYVSILRPDLLEQVQVSLGGVPLRAVRPHDKMHWKGECEISSTLHGPTLQIECPLGQFPGNSADKRRLGWAVHKVHLHYSGFKRDSMSTSLDSGLSQLLAEQIELEFGQRPPELSDLSSMFLNLLKVQKRQQLTIAALQSSLQRQAYRMQEREADRAVRIDQLELLRSLVERIALLEERI